MTKLSRDHLRHLLELIEGKHLPLRYSDNLYSQSQQSITSISILENLLRCRMKITVILSRQASIEPQEVANAKTSLKIGSNMRCEINAPIKQRPRNSVASENVRQRQAHT